MGVVARFDVYLVTLDPTVGAEMRKARPCVVISPDEMNLHLKTVIVAPMTTKGFSYPTRIACTFQRKRGQIVLDQIQTVDRARLAKRLGKLNPSQAMSVLDALGALFAE